jgi:PEP-CTERM motif
LSTFFRNLTVLTIMAALGAASASAEIAVEVYKFTGQCSTDCTGSGTGTLILLAGYVLGTPLVDDDLYSFNYTSNLIPDLSIHNDPNESLSGILPVGLGPANITISDGNGSTFSSSSDGEWSAFIPSDDAGTNGIWSTPSTTPTPEPSTLPLVGICLAGVIFLRGRWRKASWVSGSLRS